MKIFFIPGAYDGCYYYRGYLPAIYGGMTCDQNFNETGRMDNMAIKQQCDNSDVLVFQRPNDSTRVDLMRLYKRAGKFIVFENDDTYLPDKGVPLNMLGSNQARNLAIELSRNIEQTLKIADLVIASTEALAAEYRAITHKPVVVRKNTIDPLDEWSRKRREGKTRIGFIGSVTSNFDYTDVKDQIRELAFRKDIELVALGNFKGQRGYEDDDAFWGSMPVEWHSFVPVTRYYKKIADMQLDIALIPRGDNYFNRCKSNIKFLELSLLKIPIIAQGFTTNDSPYQGKNDKKYMQIVTDNSTWLKTVDNTIKNYTKYATLAEQAHDYVLEEYNIRKYAPKWRQIIEQYAN